MDQGHMRIDPHVHVLPDKRLRGLMRWINRAFPGHPVSESITADGIIADLEKQGVTHFFNLAYPLKPDETEPLNAWNLDFCNRTPGAIPFASLHAENPNPQKIAQAAIDAGFVGIKFHPFVQRFDPWDPRLHEVYDFMEDARRPVIFHTGFEDFYKRPMPVARLEAMLAGNPTMPAVFVHMAFPEIEWAFEMLDQYPGLYLDATNVLACLRPMFRPMLAAVKNGKEFPQLLARGIARHCDRVMYGSDHPAGMGGLPEIHRDLEDLEVEEGVRHWLAVGTARAFIESFIPGFDWGRRLGTGP